MIKITEQCVKNLVLQKHETQKVLECVLPKI